MWLLWISGKDLQWDKYVEHSLYYLAHKYGFCILTYELQSTEYWIEGTVSLR